MTQPLQTSCQPSPTPLSLVTNLPCMCPLPHVVLPNHTFVPGTGPPFSHPTMTNLIDERTGVGLGAQWQRPGTVRPTWPLPSSPGYPRPDIRKQLSGRCVEGGLPQARLSPQLSLSASEVYFNFLQSSAFSEQGTPCLPAAQMGRPKDRSDSCPTEAQRHLPDGAGLHAEDSSLPHTILPEWGTGKGRCLLGLRAIPCPIAAVTRLTARPCPGPKVDKGGGTHPSPPWWAGLPTPTSHIFCPSNREG